MNKVINNQTIVASGVFTTGNIDLQNWPRTANTRIGITAVITGSGTAKLEYLVPTTSIDGAGLDGFGGFMEPTGASDIGAGLTAGSYTAEFTPIQSACLRFRVTETGGASSITVTIHAIIK